MINYDEIIVYYNKTNVDLYIKKYSINNNNTILLVTIIRILVASKPIKCPVFLCIPVCVMYLPRLLANSELYTIFMAYIFTFPAVW